MVAATAKLNLNYSLQGESISLAQYKISNKQYFLLHTFVLKTIIVAGNIMLTYRDFTLIN